MEENAKNLNELIGIPSAANSSAVVNEKGTGLTWKEEEKQSRFVTVNLEEGETLRFLRSDYAGHLICKPEEEKLYELSLFFRDGSELVISELTKEAAIKGAAEILNSIE